MIEGARKGSSLQVLLVGNNPKDLGGMLEVINALKGRIITTEIAFDIKSILQRLLRFRPNFVLIDDNIGSIELRRAIHVLINNRSTRNIPITVVKNSNYRDAFPSSGALDFVLKNQLSPEALYATIRNSLKLRRTRDYLVKAYHKRTRQLRDLLGGT